MKKFFFCVLLSATILTISDVKAADPEAKPSTVSEFVSSKLNGVIFDKQTKENLAGAVVTVNGRKLYSDLDGKFVINDLSSSKVQVKVSMISYEDKTFEIDLNNTSSFQIELNQR